MGGVDQRLQRLDVTQGLVGGIIVQAVELRQAREGRVRLGREVIATDDDLVIDAVEIE